MQSNLTLALSEGLNRHYGIALTSLKEKLVYRFDFFMSLISAIMTAGMLYYLWSAIYHNATDIDMPLQSLVTYVVLGQVFNFTRISWAQRRVFFRVSGSISSGDVATDLVRPVDYQSRQFSEALGMFLAEMLLINLPAYLLSLLVFGISTPASGEAALGFVISLGSAFLLAFSFNFLIVILAFWTLSTYGLLSAQKAIFDILAGTIIPLSLLPGWLRDVALILPFRGLAYTPLSIYIGTIEGAAIWTSILEQCLWASLFILITRFVWFKALHRLVIQGG